MIRARIGQRREQALQAKWVECALTKSSAVTAVYKGTKQGEKPALLRSYDSRKEPSPEANCTIWQAGRATSATGLAFKPIQIGQSVFIDEGAGKYNPSPVVLDEAVRNEWPGREVGVFVSIGTGKRPEGTTQQSHLWWEGFVGGGMGDFAEARRRLIAKIEGCEDTHREMLSKHLAERGVGEENYYRLNVEVGVGEFGMNEWARLSDISTNTRMYLARPEVEHMNREASAKLARIHKSKMRWERQLAAPQQQEPMTQNQSMMQNRWSQPLPTVPPPSNPMAVELPAEDVIPTNYRPQSMQYRPTYHHTPSVADMKYTVIASDEYPQPVDSATAFSPQQHSPPFRPSMESAQRSNSSLRHSPRQSADFQYQNGAGNGQRQSPPPLPPKTPLPYPDQPQSPRTFMNMGSLGRNLPYPETDAPPPAVNMARKPEYGVR